MEERIEISMLLDYYSVLLTDKQNDIMTLYYNEDLSLAEIAELNDTSRQAIHDTIRRCNKLLLDYESKLGLMSKNQGLADSRESINLKLDIIKKKTSDKEILELLDDIEKNISECF